MPVRFIGFRLFSSISDPENAVFAFEIRDCGVIKITISFTSSSSWYDTDLITDNASLKSDCG